MAEPSTRLVIFARRPRPGHAKTRLGRTVGELAAAGLYARLLYRYLERLLAGGIVNATLSLADAGDVEYFALAYPMFEVTPQPPGDLGARMQVAFEREFARGAEWVVLTGSDIPALGVAQVQAAFAALQQTPVVLGPAQDGGYYLIGMRRPGYDLFTDMVWSTPEVLSQTLARAQAQGAAVTLLEQLADVDDAADLAAYRQSEEQ